MKRSNPHRSHPHGSVSGLQLLVQSPNKLTDETATLKRGGARPFTLRALFMNHWVSPRGTRQLLK